jgi:hypothetical protein
MRKDLILVFGLSVSLAGIATATEAVQPPAAAQPPLEAAAPVNAPAAAGVVAPAAPAAPAAPVAAAPAAAPAAAVAAAEDPMICKKITETGTLGRKKKLCMTASQWEEHRKNARGVMRSIDSGAGAQNSGVSGGG